MTEQGSGQWSPDGKWWWNGREWRPASEHQGSVPPSQSPVSPPQTPPTGGVHPARKRPRRFLWGCAGAIALLVLLGVCVAVVNSGTNTKSRSIAGTSPSATPTVKTAASSAPPPTAAKPQFATFHDGTSRVGQDVQPGTYRTRTGSPGCYLARLKGFSGQLDDIAANETTNGPAVVTIAATDKGFESRGCATWTSDLSAITKSPTSFGDGDLIVGTDIQPGTYRSNGSGQCYYARLAGFSHELGDIIANDNGQGPVVVTIAAGDKGFESSGCGTWTTS